MRTCPACLRTRAWTGPESSQLPDFETPLDAGPEVRRWIGSSTRRRRWTSRCYRLCRRGAAARRRSCARLQHQRDRATTARVAAAGPEARPRLAARAADLREPAHGAHAQTERQLMATLSRSTTAVLRPIAGGRGRRGGARRPRVGRRRVVGLLGVIGVATARPRMRSAARSTRSTTRASRPCARGSTAAAASALARVPRLSRDLSRVRAARRSSSTSARPPRRARDPRGEGLPQRVNYTPSSRRAGPHGGRHHLRRLLGPRHRPRGPARAHRRRARRRRRDPPRPQQARRLRRGRARGARAASRRARVRRRGTGAPRAARSPTAAPATAPASGAPGRRAARRRLGAALGLVGRRGRRHRRSGTLPTGPGERDRAHRPSAARARRGIRGGIGSATTGQARLRDGRRGRGRRGAFATPTGGICFALEEASTAQWPPSLRARVFLCTMLSTVTLWTLTAVRENDKSFQGFVKFGSFLQGAARYELWEVPLMVVPALALGALGAAFCRINARLSRWRRQHVLGRPRRVVEVLLVVALTATVMFWLPVMLDSTGAVFKCGAFDNGYYCGRQRKWPEIGPGMRPTSCNYMPASGVRRWRRRVLGPRRSRWRPPSRRSRRSSTIRTRSRPPRSACGVYARRTDVRHRRAVGALRAVHPHRRRARPALGRVVARDDGQGVDGGVAIQPGIYAVVGRDALERHANPIKLVVILRGNELYLITPIMAAVLVQVGGRPLGVSVYDLHIELKCIPLIKPRRRAAHAARRTGDGRARRRAALDWHVGERGVLGACALTSRRAAATRGSPRPSAAATAAQSAARRRPRRRRVAHRRDRRQPAREMPPLQR